jgi:hypothetical protein
MKSIKEILFYTLIIICSVSCRISNNGVVVQSMFFQTNP